MSYIPLIARVDALPPLPQSVLKLEEIFKQEYPDIDELIKIITIDPLITADILSKVNAPLYGFSTKIVSVLQAITLLGAPQIRSIILASSIQECFEINLKPYNITPSMFSKISLTQSELLFQWYMNIDINLARKLTPIAFLMETGKVLIAKEILEEDKEKSFQNDLLIYENISDVETIHTMMNTAQVNALVFKHLNLNASFWQTMQYFDSNKKIPSELQESITILEIIRSAINTQEQLSENSLNKAFKLLEEKGYKVDVFQRAVKRVKAKYYE